MCFELGFYTPYPQHSRGWIKDALLLKGMEGWGWKEAEKEESRKVLNYQQLLVERRPTLSS